MTMQDILSEARKLSPGQRAELVEEIIRMDADDVALTPDQAADLRRRIDDYKAGRTKFSPGPEVVERVRNRRDV